MKNKVLKKWRWALALTAVMALAGVAWAETNYYSYPEYPGKTELTPAPIPDWVSGDIFSGQYTESDNIFVDTTKDNNDVKVRQDVAGLVGGGFSENNYEVAVNLVKTGADIGVAVIGAATRLGNAVNNDVVIDSGTIGSGTQAAPGQVYGGYVTSGNGYAESNCVEINGGTINDAVVGGFIQGPVPHSWNLAWKTFGTGYAKFNTVTVNGGTVAHQVIGGRANTGYANNNEVIIGENVTELTAQDIVGGRSVSGDASENHVKIYGGINHNSDIKGGDAGEKAEDNTVYISAGSKTVGTSNIIGGAGPGGAKGNNVEIDRGTILDSNNSPLHIAGGQSINDNALVEKNKVLIKGTSTILGNTGGTVEVAGGNTGQTNAINQNNTVRVEGTPTFKGTVKLFGGITQDGEGNVQNNTVEIAGTPKIDNSGTLIVYGGGDATVNADNTVRISGGFTFGAGAAVNLYGHQPGSYTTVLGNTLDLQAIAPLSVTDVGNFHKFIFTVPAGFDYANDSVLSASTADFGTTPPTIEVKGVDLDKLDEGDSFNLFSAATLDGTYVTKKIGAIDTDGNGIELEIEKVGNVLKATRPANASTVKITDPDQFDFGASTTAKYITADDFTWTGDWLANPKVISGLSLADWIYFDLTPTSWGISPNLNLPRGAYTDTLTIEFSNGARATVPVTFTVAGSIPPPGSALPEETVPTPSGSSSGGGCDAGLAGLAGLGLLIAGALTRGNGKR
jgi:hypothetical protein